MDAAPDTPPRRRGPQAPRAGVTNDKRATLCARMLLTRRHLGDIERARELLGQAIAGARKLGLGNIERKAVALLQ
jgi:hypothetical protein